MTASGSCKTNAASVMALIGALNIVVMAVIGTHNIVVMDMIGTNNLPIQKLNAAIFTGQFHCELFEAMTFTVNELDK
jgi:hypothetical protein